MVLGAVLGCPSGSLLPFLLAPGTLFCYLLESKEVRELVFQIFINFAGALGYPSDPFGAPGLSFGAGGYPPWASWGPFWVPLVLVGSLLVALGRCAVHYSVMVLLGVLGDMLSLNH